MSGLDVSRGGVVAVDTARLMTAAAVMAHQARRLRDVATDVAGVQWELWQLGNVAGWEVLEAARRAVRQAELVTTDLGSLGGRLARTAEAYEETELRARWEFANLQGNDGDRVLVEARARELGLDVDTLGDEVSMFSARADAWWQMASQYAQPLMGSPLGAVGANTGGVLIFGLLAMIQHLDRGTVSPGAPLQGPAKPVVVRVVPQPLPMQRTVTEPKPQPPQRPLATPPPPPPQRPVAPPSSLAALARRIPTGAAQVSIERFAMPGGRTEWGVYIAGTRSSAMGGGEPWDMMSNTELYFGERSASSDAVFEAMRTAGVGSDEPVHLVGHSQGGMIAAGVATSGDYAVGSITTFGSPVEAVVPDSVLSIRVRHDDDPVAALAGVGSAAGSGSIDSVVVSRTGNPERGLHDLAIPTHGLDEYARTAELFEASGDARVRGAERLVAQLGRAESVTRTDYAAVRVQ